MLKGVFLGISIACFLVSFIFFITSTAGYLQANVITGSVISPNKLTFYSLIGLAASFITGVFFLFLVIRNQRKS
jgi:hypothetical protein